MGNEGFSLKSFNLILDFPNWEFFFKIKLKIPADKPADLESQTHGSTGTCCKLSGWLGNININININDQILKCFPSENKAFKPTSILEK